MKKILVVFTTLMMALVLIGCTKETKTFIAGEIMANPDDSLSTYERNVQRANTLASRVWQDYYDEELLSSFEYYPFRNNMEESASVWHYTALFSLYNRLGSINKTADIETKLDYITKGLEYYKEARGDGYRVYAVNRGFMPGRAFTGPNTNVYDDNMWIAREFINLYEVINDQKYLEMAEEVIRYCLTGWDSSINQETGLEWGGIYWGPYYASKHTCSNGPIISPLIRLYDKTSKTEYLDWAKKVYEFAYQTFRRNDDIYGDMIGTERNFSKQTTSHGDLDLTAYSYNSGTMISGAVMLYKATNETRYLEEAIRTAESSFNYFANKEIKDGFVQFPVATTTWFNLTLFIGYYDLFTVYEGASKYLDSIQKSIDYAYNNYLYEDSIPTNWLLGWLYGFEKDNTKDVMDQASHAEMYALLAQYELLKEAKNEK